jgi:hypothetical protein
LLPGGFAVVRVPNYVSVNRLIMGSRWCGFHYPYHLNYFTPKTLGQLAAEAGFATSFGVSRRPPTSDNIWAILTKRAGVTPRNPGRHCRSRASDAGAGFIEPVKSFDDIVRCDVVRFATADLSGLDIGLRLGWRVEGMCEAAHTPPGRLGYNHRTSLPRRSTGDDEKSTAGFATIC